MFHYNQAQMAEALRQVDLKRGDVVFCHSNLGFFGIPEAGRSLEAAFDTVFGAFTEVLGEEGALVVPTFTYSFGKCRGVFDVDKTPSTVGTFTEMLRTLPGAYRSADPMFSVAAVGGRAEEMTANVPVECFGLDSFWDRFLKADGIICNLNFDAGSTFIHYVEKCLNVPYRYDKLFSGMFRKGEQIYRGAAIFFCHDFSNHDTMAVFEAFDALARERQLVRTARVGRGAIVAIKAIDTYRLIAETLPDRPYFLTVAGAKGVEPVMLRQTRAFDVNLSKSASPIEMVEGLWQLPRDIVSDGYDAALAALATLAPMTIHEYPTGTHCSTWLVPEKWTCLEGYLETLAGHRLFAYSDNPLHVASYSQSFSGEVTREVLFEHLAVHPTRRQAIPYRNLWPERDWGLCCSQETKEALTDEAYRVVIRTKFSYGILKVGEIIARGEREACIFLCAHLCHPVQANDGLSGVAVGLDVMRELLRRSNLRYTYRLLIVPETIGVMTYLSQEQEVIPSVKGGLCLDMLGLDNPHALQLSHIGDADFDRCCIAALKKHDPEGWIGDFLTVANDDQQQFNAPGVHLPVLSLSRVLKPSGDVPYLYPEHHTHFDTPDLIVLERLQESRDLVLHIINLWEMNGH